MNWLNGFLADNLMGFRAADLPNFLFAVFLAGFLALVLGRIRGSREGAITTQIVIIAMATTVVITLVRFSLPLAVALLAVMMLVRFRGAFNEFKDQTYLYLAIAIGVGCGSGATILTAIGFVPIVLILLMSKRNPE